MRTAAAGVHHALYAALRLHDFAAFAQSQLKEREMAGLPPYSHLAMLRADAHTVVARFDALSRDLTIWAPTQAPFFVPIPASILVGPLVMLLTGLLSKMGVYGLFRILLPIFPEVLPALAPALMALAVRHRRPSSSLLCWGTHPHPHPHPPRAQVLDVVAGLHAPL